MIKHPLPGIIAIGLAASLSAETPAEPATGAASGSTTAVQAVTPPIEVPPAEPATGAVSDSTTAVEAVTPPIEVPPAPPPIDPAVVRTDSSYALGFRSGSTFAQQFGRFGVTAADLEQESFLKGFMAALDGTRPGEEEETKLQAAMEALGNLLEKREEQLAATNLEAGRKFLEENAKREGVVTNASGLQYEIIEPGGDEKYVAPKDDEETEKEFLVHYRGTLIDGKEFDKSPEGEAVPMTLQVVDGFREALTTMPVGSKWRVYLPSDLAYGEERRSIEIGPNSTLIFDLHLVKIQDAPPAQGGFPFPMPQGQ